MNERIIELAERMTLPGGKCDHVSASEVMEVTNWILETQGSGIGLIIAERDRQISIEGWTPEHDDAHSTGELSHAAACYAMSRRSRLTIGLRHIWPWDVKWWKPTPENRIRELEKAGALIAAEIDRLLRLKAPEDNSVSDGGGGHAAGASSETPSSSNAVLPPPVSEKKDLELLRQRAEAGDKFKAFVHSYLTQHGVPEGDPTNQHQIEGCRIGARLDLLLAKVSESPVGSTATGVGDEKRAREAAESCLSLDEPDDEWLITAAKVILTAIRKSKSPSNELLDWAETLLCNAVPMSHCTQEEWDEAIHKWRDRKHGVPSLSEPKEQKSLGEPGAVHAKHPTRQN